MVGAAGLDLSVGAGIVLAGVEWTVVAFQPQYGHVLLCRPDGEQRQTTVRALLHHPDRRQSSGPGELPAASRGRQPAVLSDLTEQQQERLRLRVAHLLEAETGFRSGDPLRPAPGEPRAAYDPATTTLGARRLAKVAELGALDGAAARLLGLERVSQRTLERLAEMNQRVLTNLDRIITALQASNDPQTNLEAAPDAG
ncbi:MAG TPA: hypothetical protein VFA46_11735 [Actinomycetes bacterium]|jgi:hypothetical protein|nr:hypothetical protein [Actinomycetes bacterium]